MTKLRVLIPVLALLAACSDPTSQSSAQPALPQPTRAPPADAAAMKVSFAPVVKKAAPAVVNISSKRLVRQQVDPFWELFGMGAPRGRVEGSLGSGVIVRADGVIVTNNHVVEGGQEITVALADRREFPAKVLLADPKTDLAVLKIEVGAERLPVLAIDDSGDAQVGDLVLAIGDPFGVGQTVTNGIISALNRSADPSGDAASSYIQTDAAINPGNSGGPLLDIKGQVIGINTAIVAAGQGIGFAIPINMAKEILPELKSTGQVTRGWLGVGIQEVSPEIARAVGLKEVKGAMVNMVYPGDPADKAGVKKGDIILAINAQPIKNPFDLTHLIATLKPGSKIAITVWRDKREMTLSTKLEKRSDEHVAELGGQQEEEEGKETKETKDSLGLTLKNITPEIAGRLKLDDAKGVLVTGVDPKGPAADGDIKKGDVIKEINRHEIGGISDYLKVLKALKKGDTVLLRVVRNGRPFYMAIDIP